MKLKKKLFDTIPYNIIYMVFTTFYRYPTICKFLTGQFSIDIKGYDYSFCLWIYLNLLEKAAYLLSVP